VRIPERCIIEGTGSRESLFKVGGVLMRDEQYFGRKNNVINLKQANGEGSGVILKKSTNFGK
jgi:hypothetical protein